MHLMIVGAKFYDELEIATIMDSILMLMLAPKLCIRTSIPKADGNGGQSVRLAMGVEGAGYGIGYCNRKCKKNNNQPISVCIICSR